MNIAGPCVDISHVQMMETWCRVIFMHKDDTEKWETYTTDSLQITSDNNGLYYVHGDYPWARIQGPVLRMTSEIIAPLLGYLLAKRT